MSSRRIVVTGGTGFVGANLVRTMLADGATVCVLSRPGSDRWRLQDVLDDVRVMDVDVRDAAGLTQAMRETKPEQVFHLASHGNSSWETDTREIHDVVIGGFANVISACASAGCPVLVNTGSSSEYGLKDHAPAESECPEPNSHYAIAKVAATMMGRYEATRQAMRIVTLRLYSAYGPWEDPRRLMPTLIARGLRNEWPPLVNPETARDYVFIDDVVEAFRRAADNARTGTVYNVGTGVQTSLRQVVDVAARVLAISSAPEWSTMPARVWDTKTWVADAGAIRRDLGWTPQCDVQQGMRRLVDWYKGWRSA